MKVLHISDTKYRIFHVSVYGLFDKLPLLSLDLDVFKAELLLFFKIVPIFLGHPVLPQLLEMIASCSTRLHHATCMSTATCNGLFSQKFQGKMQHVTPVMTSL